MIIRMEPGSVWWIMVVIFVEVSPISSQSSYYPKAIPTEAGGAICTLSRKLKDVTPWAVGQVSELKKTRDDYESKFLDWKLHFNGNSECGENETILDEILTTLERVNEEIHALPSKAIHAGALAAKSAGRLDEFITVFSNAEKSSTSIFEKTSGSASRYCLGGGGNAAKRRNLFDCFPTGGKIEMGENNLARIPENAPHKEEPNLIDAIKNINHSAITGYVKRYDGDENAGCNLISGKAGIIGSELEDGFWWGGGILTIGKGFEGELKGEKFGPGEIGNAIGGEESSKAFWTGSPSTIQHLNKTLAAFQAFKDATSRITQKFSKIEKIEKQIEPCLSNETMEEGPTQSCFRSAVKLNAELQAANALLARYHKEKGPLPSGSSLILHQRVVNFWLPFAFLL
ncbi:unnamed protein product [Trypanosoma congolense IL3000]|uniref:WGS project CAEQ00000000 data, annotated contig 1049 n=1 Tax=Trypanosoma congolense (strain IL3000) TaxID=1068625 RepID=F9W3G1_TRYCI|nr:unnamed protein product [Trypanosoma congolense IL3000]